MKISLYMYMFIEPSYLQRVEKWTKNYVMYVTFFKSTYLHTYSILYAYVFVLQELMKYMQLKPILSEYDYKKSSVLVFLQGHRFLQSHFNTDLI